MEISSELSQKIKNMGLLCAILVVTIHIDWPHNNPLSVGWFMYEVFAQGISRIAVPFFFVVSGFFLSKHFDDDNWYLCEIRKRSKSLLVPFICWCVIFVIMIILVCIVSDIFAHRPLGSNIQIMREESSLFRIFGFDLTDYPLYIPLWYVRCLFIFTMISFVFKRVVEQFGYIWLFIAFVFNLVSIYISNEAIRNFFNVGCSASGIFYFSVGVFLCKNNLKTDKKNIIFSGIIGVGLLILKLIFVYNTWQFDNIIGKLSLPFLLYFIWNSVSNSRWPQWLTKSSFPIFLMHSIVLSYLTLVLKHIPIGKTLSAFIVLGTSIGISIMVAILLRRLVPRVASVLFGGR